MIGFGAHAVGNGAAEFLFVLCCGQCGNDEKTKDQKLDSCPST
jgi:hypothetical protein